MIDLGLFREIFQSLNKNKLRTLLSGFTVAFAIMLFTILFGIANGFQNTFNNEFAGDANNSIFIYSGRTSKAVEGYQTGRRIQFDNPLYSEIKQEFSDDIEFITGRVYKNVTASFGNEKVVIQSELLTLTISLLRSLKLKMGDLLILLTSKITQRIL